MGWLLERNGERLQTNRNRRRGHWSIDFGLAIRKQRRVSKLWRRVTIGAIPRVILKNNLEVNGGRDFKSWANKMISLISW
jgi:hypothetical protein